MKRPAAQAYMCTSLWYGPSGLLSARQDKRAAPLRVAAERVKIVEASRAQSYTCTSTSAPHSLGTCLETGNYTTGGRVFRPFRLCFFLVLIIVNDELLLMLCLFPCGVMIFLILLRMVP